ncbi:MAG: DUF3551 domain-containing protein [Pseudolabrys sp.]|nr:DUF3551 domain-containing protein [Pseudolabrys sp.]
MRHLVAATVLAAALSGLTTPGHAADEWPFCAYYAGGRNGGGTNCGFASMAQCQETLRGLGGICQPNPRVQAFYPGPRAVRHRSRHY